MKISAIAVILLCGCSKPSEAPPRGIKIAEAEVKDASFVTFNIHCSTPCFESSKNYEFIWRLKP